MGLTDFLFGSKDKISKKSNFSPEQEKFFKGFLGQLQGMKGGANQATGLLQQYMDPESSVFQNFEEPYLRAFEEQTIPGINEQYAGAGATGGGLSSSGFAQSLGAAKGGLQTNLAQMKSQMQRQAIMDFLGQYNQQGQTGLSAQPFSYVNKPGSQGIVGPALGAVASGLTGGAMGGLGGALSSLGGTLFGGGGFKSSPMASQMDMGFRMGAPGMWG